MIENVAIVSIVANVTLSCGKIAVGVLTDSAAILAEGLHSFMDIFASAIGFVGIILSKKPVDEKHPYGHYKFEVLAGVIITLILLGSGLWIVYGAYQGFIKPNRIKINYLAFIVMVVSALVNEIMARVKIHFGKAENSIALLSDGVHSRVDVFVSLAILCGLFFTNYWIYTDSLLALLIGMYIIRTSFTLGKEAVDSLLDSSAGKEIDDKIRSIAKESNVEVSNVKTQKKGSSIMANLEIKLPPDLNVETASKLSADLRGVLMKNINNLLYVVIQIDSYKVSTGYYSPRFGRAIDWQIRGEARKGLSDRRGPNGYCVCLQCDYKIVHQRGVPCAALICPHCGTKLERQL